MSSITGISSAAGMAALMSARPVQQAPAPAPVAPKTDGDGDSDGDMGDSMARASGKGNNIDVRG